MKLSYSGWAKLATGRPQDLADVEAIREAKERHPKTSGINRAP